MRSRCKTGLRTASTFSTGSMHNDHAVHIIFMQCLQLYYPEDNSRSSLPFHVPRSSGFGPFSRQSSHGGEMYSVCKHEFHGFFDLDTRRLVQHPRASQRSRCFTKLTRVRVECISDTLRVQPCASGDRFITSVLTVNGVGDNMVSAARRNVSVVSHSSTALAPKWGSSVFTRNQAPQLRRKVGATGLTDHPLCRSWGGVAACNSARKGPFFLGNVIIMTARQFRLVAWYKVYA